MNTSQIKLKWPGYLLGILFVLSMSCTKYYKPVPVDTSTPGSKATVIVNGYQEKILILRKGRYGYLIDTFRIDNDAMTLMVTLKKLDPSHSEYVLAKGRKYGYTDKSVLQEMHIYTKDTSASSIKNAVVIPFDQIEKIELIEHDKGRTSTSYFIGTSVTIVLIAAIIAGVAVGSAVQSMNSMTSCPYISGYKNGDYVLQGEMFAGAIKRSMERPDYLPLDIHPVNGEFQLKISNELEEKQYTNYADLILIEHTTGKRAFIGTDGKTYLVSDPVKPATANLNDQRDVLKAISMKDNLVCSFDDTLFTSRKTDLTLTFKPKPNNGHAKLVLNLKNSLWVEKLYDEFATSFAGRYDAWQDKLGKRDGEELYQWLEEQQIPLTISIGTSSGWKEITKLNTIGPLMHREVVVPVALEMAGEEPVRIRLSTGFLFWEVDYAAMDFTVDEPVVTTTLKPISAMDERGNDVLLQVADDDELYLAQPEKGNYAMLKYKAGEAPASGKTYSVVLSTGGYYEPIRNLEGRADLSFIRRFKKPGAMNTYSKERYRDIFTPQAFTVLNQD